MWQHINQIRGPVFENLSELKPIISQIPLKVWGEIIDSKAVSKTTYGLGLYCSQPEMIKDKLTDIIMQYNIMIYLPVCTKNKWICKKIIMITPRQIFLEAAVIQINKTINTTVCHRKSINKYRLLLIKVNICSQSWGKSEWILTQNKAQKCI